MKRAGMFLIAVSLILSVSANAQILDLGKKVKEKAKERAANKTEEGIDKTLDKTEEGISNLFNDEEETEQEKEVEEKAEIQDGKNSFKSYTKFDFIPGEKVIFYDDFSDVNIGDFPLNWDTQASGEVVNIEGTPGKWFKIKGEYSYFVPLLKSFEFPENFTVEFDAIAPEGREFSIELFQQDDNSFPDGYYPGRGGTFMSFIAEGFVNWNVWDNEDESKTRTGDSKHTEYDDNQILHYSIWGQKSRLRVYVNEEKALDLPRAILTELKYNRIRIGNYPDADMYFTNFRIAVGDPDTRSRLITEGKLVTRGIHFNSGSDQIKPESYGVIKDIAQTLKDNPNVRIKIIGHTDSDGDANMNLDLSKRRAQSVKNTLSNEFNIDSARMETDGKGESEPTDSNDTSSGKASNRRVEFIKL